MNWPDPDGSCVHASLITLFRWQGQHELADYWRQKYGGGEFPSTIYEKLNREGIRFALTFKTNDVGFLEWAVSTRRGAAVAIRKQTHMVTLVHLDQEWAGIIDNNSPQSIKWVPREDFLEDWFTSNSWALAPVYTPAPPRPWR